MVHVVDKMQLHRIAEILRDFGYVFFVFLGQNHFEQSSAMSGQKFFFQAADGKNLAAQRDFAGHGDIAADGDAAQGAGKGGCDGDAG